MLNAKAPSRRPNALHLSCRTDAIVWNDMEDIPDLTPDSDDDDDDEPQVGEEVLNDGDHVFMATIPCEAEFI
jgi:hypothetical protein